MINIIIVNHHTYLRGLTSQGNTACVKRFSEKARIEIWISMDRITNLNSKVEFKISFLHETQGEFFYVVKFSLNQSKRPTGSSRTNDENPKGIICQKLSEFGIFRKLKDWGRRRVHSTAFICGKEPSKFMAGGNWFEGQFIKSQFEKLEKDLEINGYCNNLTTILSNKEFLLSCYNNIKYNLDKKTRDNIKEMWFEEVINTFRNGKFNFKPNRKIYISKRNNKLKLFISFSKDKIIQEALRTLLEFIFERYFRDSFYGFKANKGCHTALKVLQYQYSRSIWFITGNLEQSYFIKNHKILIKILRTRIKDEPFIDLIYKYLKIYENSEMINSIKVELKQKKTLFPVLYNIYMHFFDIWMEDYLIPKYTKKNNKEVNLRNAKMLLPTTTKDLNFQKVYYIRYANDFFIGVVGSKDLCFKIIDEIKTVLKNILVLTLNLEKTRITHTFNEKALFLGYEIYCTPTILKRISSNLKKNLTRRTINCILSAPIKQIVEFLKNKGFVNRTGNPTRNSRYLNFDLWNIIEIYKSIEKRILNYYNLANNYGRMAARVHFILKYSCALTISSKMKLRTLRRVFKTYGKNLAINHNGKKIMYPSITYKRLRIGKKKSTTIKMV